MRKAEVDHAWSECRKPERAQLSVDGLEVAGKDVLALIPITSRITAFIGPNGAGKTGFLASLHGVVNNVNVARSVLKKINGCFRGRPFSIGSGHRAPEGMQVELIDVSLDVHNIRQYCVGQANFEELLAHFEPNVANQAQLGLYRHVCGRAYESFSVLEIDAPAIPSVAEMMSNGEDEEVYPFFQVKLNGLSYDSRTMGFGELCACYLLWRLSRASKGTIILLDEPDSHLSPASRRALMDAMAIFAKDRQLWVAFTTHSTDMLESLQDSEIYFVSANIASSSCAISPIRQRRQATRLLGLSAPRRLLIAVEDVDAVSAAWTILNKWGSDVCRLVDVQIVAGGATEVVDFVKKFPSTRICSAIALLDGDKREYLDESRGIFCLPGHNDPVEAARIQISADCNVFAHLLGVDSVELTASIANISHVNHHDFLTRLLDEQHIEGKGVHDIRTALMSAWLSRDDIEMESRDLVRRITEIVDSID